MFQSAVVNLTQAYKIVTFFRVPSNIYKSIFEFKQLIASFVMPDLGYNIASYVYTNSRTEVFY